MSSFEDRVALLCLAHYNSLPKTGKPNDQQWTVLSCVVEYDNIEDKLKLVSLGTGSKCLGGTQMSCKGDKINDSHSEVLARRGFLRYIYDQIINKSSIFIYNSKHCVYSKSDNISYHFFSTHTPCGDASIFPKSEDLLTNVGQEFVTDKKRKNNDIIVECSKKRKPDKSNNNDKPIVKDIHRTGAKCLELSAVTDPLKPGVDYHVLGVIRTKPGRGDPTLSISCSDKLSRWNILGVQGALLSLILDKPIYFESIIISQDSPVCVQALHRAIIDRWNIENIELCTPFKINTPKIMATSKTIKFVHGKSTSVVKLPCSSGIIWVNVRENPLEVTVNGSKQGVTKSKLKEGMGALLICRKRLYEQFLKIMDEHPSLRERIFDEKCANYRLLSYHTAKLLSKSYQHAWSEVLQNCFKLWINKPVFYKKFTLY